MDSVTNQNHSQQTIYYANGSVLGQITGLYYNRFKYYDPSMGTYISKDSIGLVGNNNPTLYGYTIDSNTMIDLWELDCELPQRKYKHITQFL